MDFDDYDPNNFRGAFNRWGKRLIKFFDGATIRARLDCSVELSRPAAQAIAVPLLATFGDEAREFRFRQLVGHMISHLMKVLGYELDQPEVRIPDGDPFSRAARYRRKR